MGDLVKDLIEVFQGTVVSEDDLGRIVAEQCPASPQVAHAMSYLRRHFPVGIFSKKIAELSDTPFDPITLRRAALALNRRGGEDANIVAFPRIRKSGGKAY